MGMAKQILSSIWGLEWFSKNWLDGVTRHLLFEDRKPVLFLTRKEARKYADREYGYIRFRKDLRAEPHGWRMPRPVKITGVEWSQP